MLCNLISSSHNVSLFIFVSTGFGGASSSVNFSARITGNGCPHTELRENDLDNLRFELAKVNPLWLFCIIFCRYKRQFCVFFPSFHADRGWDSDLKAGAFGQRKVCSRYQEPAGNGSSCQRQAEPVQRLARSPDVCPVRTLHMQKDSFRFCSSPVT